MKRLNRIFPAFALFLLGAGASFAQEVVRPSILSTWSGELGWRSGIVYEHPISKHFSMRYNTGIVAFQRIQPYETGPNQMVITMEYMGLMPYVAIGTRWYPSVRANNSGFYLGLDLQYNHHKGKFGINPKHDYYKLEQEGLLVLNIGYAYSLTEHLNIKTALLPNVGFDLANKGKTMYGVIDLRWDLGLTYSF